MTRLPREKLEEIRARVEDVTKGPWWVRANRELVDACVRDIPALLGHVVALEADIDQIAGALLDGIMDPLSDLKLYGCSVPEIRKMVAFWKSHNPTPDKEGA